MDVYMHVSSTLALGGGVWSPLSSGHFMPREITPKPSIIWIGGWMGPEASLDDIKKRKF
jgi:hypothetical protein